MKKILLPLFEEYCNKKKLTIKTFDLKETQNGNWHPSVDLYLCLSNNDAIRFKTHKIGSGCGAMIIHGYYYFPKSVLPLFEIFCKEYAKLGVSCLITTQGYQKKNNKYEKDQLDGLTRYGFEELTSYTNLRHKDENRQQTLMIKMLSDV